MSEYKVLQEFDVKKLLSLTSAAQKRKIPYAFGVKHALGSDVSVWSSGIDCSGWVRYVIYQCCKQIKIPDGSWNQAAWAEAQGFKSYGKAGYLANAGLKDGRVRLCQFTGNPGHIWFTWNGMTYESYGGNGPGSRKWNTLGLLTRVQHVFVLTNPIKV